MQSFNSEEDYQVSLRNMDTKEDFVYSARELEASNPIVIAAIIRYGVQYAVKNYGKNAVRLARNAVSKTSCPIWKNIEVQKMEKTSGSGNSRRYYERDNTHKEIEVYNSKGKHIGVMDPLTGKTIKPAIKERKIKL